MLFFVLAIRQLRVTTLGGASPQRGTQGRGERPAARRAAPAPRPRQDERQLAALLLPLSQGPRAAKLDMEPHGNVIT